MFGKVLIIILLMGIIFLSGCTDENGSGVENCGDLNQDCCEWFGQDEFGQYTGRYYCNEGLECRALICVEGPDYQSANRP
jgi:hypothetical protein